MRKRELESYCRKWLRRLNQEDKWTVEIGFFPQKDFTRNEDTFFYGDSLQDLENRTCKIRVTRVADMKKEHPEDWEYMIRVTVIHELLHMVLDPNRRLAEDALFEVGLDYTAKALYEGYGESRD